jgi:hypothetical protein
LGRRRMTKGEGKINRRRRRTGADRAAAATKQIWEFGWSEEEKTEDGSGADRQSARGDGL